MNLLSLPRFLLVSFSFDVVHVCLLIYLNTLNHLTTNLPFLDRKKVVTPGSAQRKQDEDDIDIGELEQVADSPMPIVTPEDGEFSSYPEIHKRTVETLTAKGYLNLFPIQQHCFYPVYQRHDLIARDLTGSGKTFAFGLPMVEYLRRQKHLGLRRTQAIVLAPTRELALQVSNELNKLRHTENEFKLLTVYGGVSIDDQTR